MCDSDKDDFRSFVFCGSDNILLAWTVTFLTFKIFYRHNTMKEREKTKKGIVGLL